MLARLGSRFTARSSGSPRRRAMSDEPLLDRLVDQVVDGEPVDWERVTTDHHASSRLDAGDLAALSMLRLLDHIGQAHTVFQSPNGSVRSESPALAARPVEVLSTWGRYRLDEK